MNTKTAETARYIKEIRNVKILWINTIGRNVSHFIFLLIPKGSRVVPLSIRYGFLAFRTPSLEDLMGYVGISVVSLAEWPLLRKFSATVCCSFGDIKLVQGKKGWDESPKIGYTPHFQLSGSYL